jgi:putative endonuclease
MLAVMEQSLSILERLHTRTSPAPLGDDKRQQHGEAGERSAYFHLRRQGYTVVARRWRHAFLDGEIDIIAWDGETLCFIEVKSRDAATPFAAEFHIDDSKQTALRRMAAAYLAQLPWSTPQPGTVSQRFDVVSVYLGINGKRDVRLLRNAFR